MKPKKQYLSKTGSKANKSINSKEKQAMKMIEKRKQAAKMPLSFETTAGGHKFNSQSTKNMYKPSKPINSSLGAYVLAKQRNGSLEDIKKSGAVGYKTDLISLKAPKRSNPGPKKIHMTMHNASMSKLQQDKSSISPENMHKNKYTKDKLKNLTTHIGTCSSRNASSKGKFLTQFWLKNNYFLTLLNP